MKHVFTLQDILKIANQLNELGYSHYEGFCFLIIDPERMDTTERDFPFTPAIGKTIDESMFMFLQQFVYGRLYVQVGLSEPIDECNSIIVIHSDLNRRKNREKLEFLIANTIYEFEIFNEEPGMQENEKVWTKKSLQATLDLFGDTYQAERFLTFSMDRMMSVESQLQYRSGDEEQSMSPHVAKNIRNLIEQLDWCKDFDLV